MKEESKKRIIVIEIILIVFLMVPIIFNNYSFAFLIISDSMNPMIYKNDIVLVKKKSKDIDEYTGKVISYYNPITSSVMVHRAISQEGKYLVTKGDNASFVDFYRVPSNGIIGEVVFVIKTSKIFR